MVQATDTKNMEEPTDDLEPLFDYTRVQPNFICLDDDFSDSSPVISPKRRKITDSDVDNEEKSEDIIHIGDCNEKDEEDWMPPPPKIPNGERQVTDDSTRKELRLKKQELASFAAQSAEDILRNVEETVKRDLKTSLDSSPVKIMENPIKSTCERAKIVISVQDKDGLKQFRVFVDDKFERLFKIYADKVKLDLQHLVFSFDGDKISPTATPVGLGMEDDDIIEVHVKSS